MITNKEITNVNYNLSLVYFNTGSDQYVFEIEENMLENYTYWVDGYMIKSMADGEDHFMSGNKEPVTNIIELSTNQLLEIINENIVKWEQI